MDRSKIGWSFPGIPLIAGIWLLVAPIALDYGALAPARWNGLGAGIVLVVLALLRFLKPLPPAGLVWTILAAGVWLILAPFVLGYGSFDTAAESLNARGATWNDIIVGLLVTAVAAEDAAISGEKRKRRRRGSGL